LGSTLDKLPLLPLIAVSILLALAPFAPEPHLIEKIRWLANGDALKIIDWLDILLHGGPLVLLVTKLVRGAGQS
jgi:hypothetical protein